LRTRRGSSPESGAAGVASPIGALSGGGNLPQAINVTE